MAINNVHFIDVPVVAHRFRLMQGDKRKFTDNYQTFTKAASTIDT